MFAALSLILTASVLFTFLEGCRILEERVVLQTNTDSALESVFAGYDLPMWETFHLLMRSAGAVEDEICLQEVEQVFADVSEDMLNPQNSLSIFRSNNYLRASLSGVAVQSYVLATDGKGAAFQDAVVSYVRQNVAVEALQEIKEIYDSQKELEEVDVDEKVSEAEKGIESAKAGQQTTEEVESTLEESETDRIQSTDDMGSEAARVQLAESGGSERTVVQSSELVESRTGGEQASEAMERSAEEGQQTGMSDHTGQETEEEGTQVVEEESEQENPLEILAQFKERGILSLVLNEDVRLSGKKINLKKQVSHRRLKQGTGEYESSGSPLDMLYLQYYYGRYFSDFASGATKNGLQYQKEYLICGKRSDTANLKGCVNRILALREAANLVTIASDERKRSEAEAVATVLAGAAANPLVIPAITAGILAVWAYVESILDLRTLLKGGKIAPVKTIDQWTSELQNLGQCLSVDFSAKESESGLRYSDFINLLLYLGSGSKIAMRAMDLQEMEIRGREGYENFRMDHMILALSVEAEYTFSQNFLTSVIVRDLSGTTFSIRCKSSYSYMKAGE